MSITLGAGEHSYQPVDGWAQVPDGWSLGDSGGVGVDQNDEVYVFNRGEHPMMVFASDGTFLRSWGEGLFVRPHAVSVTPDGSILCTDDGDHSVRRMSPDGHVLQVLGTPGKPAPRMSGEPFCRCTHTAVSPHGDIYVSDGYGNARIHKYSPDGTLLLSWGSSGTDDGLFNVPHNIGCDPDGWVYVADRENHRIQVFDGNGGLHAVWHNLHRPSGLFIGHGLCYVGEAGPYHKASMGVPNLGPRVSIHSLDGTLVARLGTTPSAGLGPGQYLAPHGIAVDSRGDIYVGEVAKQVWPRLFAGQAIPHPLRSLQKLVRAAVTATA